MKKQLLIFTLILFSLCAFSQIANPPSTLELCDSNNSGDESEAFDLTIVEAEVLGGQDPTVFVLTYHETLIDADNGTNAISSPTSYVNVVNPQTIFIRVEDINTGNYDTTSLTIRVNPLPSPSIPVPDLEICDDDSDGFSVFDLTLNDALILNGEVDVLVNYYETVSDASNGINAISNPTGYANIVAWQQTIYTRVESSVTGCFVLVDFDLVVNPVPTFFIDDINICEGESTVVNTGVDPVGFVFEWSLDGAIIPDAVNTSYTVTQEGNYTVQATNIISGCSFLETFNVSFDGVLTFNEPDALVACSALDTYGFGEFDLAQATAQITGGFNNLTVSYYETQADADAQINPINTAIPYTNIFPFSQPLYAVIEDNNSTCFAVVELDLIVLGTAPLPSISDYVICDESMDGFEEFSLESKNDEVLVGQMYPFDLLVTYHISEDDALNLANPLSDPFINTSNPQTIFVAVSDTYGCNRRIESFNLVADQTCMPCQDIMASIDSTAPEVNDSGVIVVEVGNEVSFIGSATFSVDGANASYTWDFGDGNMASGTQTAHQYSLEGNYTVTLTVADDNPEGCSDSISIEVIVLEGNLVVDQSQFTVEELVQNVLIGNDCSSISNITYSTGSSFNITEPNGIGYFVYEGGNFPFNEGLLISTGNAADAGGPNDNQPNSGSNNWPGDVDLDNELSINSRNATFIEFDFVPVVDQISFEFLMASEEYGTDNFECNFSDAFAFLLTDASGNTTNLAIIPGTDLPILITNIHPQNDVCDAANPEFFSGYIQTDAPPIAYNGLTVPFTAEANVTIGETYHIKLVIADDADFVYDTAVFFKAGSFDVGGICDDIGLIRVNAFNDTNTNNTFDENENSFTNGSFTYEKNNDGIINVVNSSNGSFTIISDNESDFYDITFNVDDDFDSCYSQNLPSFENISAILGDITQVDFPVIDNETCQDLAVYLINPFESPRPGFEHANTLIIENLSGSTISSGSVEFILDDNLLLNATTVSNSNLTVTTTANGFTLDFVDLLPSTSETVSITLFTPVTVPLDEIVTNSATYTTVTNDTVLDNNSSTLSEVVIGSYDPNDKMEVHGSEIVYDDFVSSDEYLYYTIRFQNIGTAEAIFVRIEDALDSQLDEDTFEMIRSSHDYVVTRTGSDLEWFFDDIDLPAEQDDAEGSIGYVYFKIKPKVGYAVSDIIPNSAAIYFDFNPPIITNTFTTTFVEPLSVDDETIINFSLHPNPANAFVTIQFNTVNGDYRMEIIDIQGKLLQSERLNTSTTIDISNLSAGVYFVRLRNSSISMIEKLIID
ncbi:choice-of-anchor L domain-containing protein [Winogradskyella sp.]|uniref:DUF7619 domain-containing protein n=1 Tax=Winogradskyella sp. TaxID=1883156 RepID=UPI0026191BE6|nr:choice-of-anchor L domain-containing protein [Winogradskyella sp.]